jgi:hypothetical protein
VGVKFLLRYTALLAEKEPSLPFLTLLAQAFDHNLRDYLIIISMTPFAAFWGSLMLLH